jgi:type VI secretion system FHA domain protein
MLGAPWRDLPQFAGTLSRPGPPHGKQAHSGLRWGASGGLHMVEVAADRGVIRPAFRFHRADFVEIPLGVDSRAETPVVILILEVTSPQPSKLGGASRQTFNEEGGSIGRENDNTWVLAHSKVSGHHAVISYRNAVYYIEDTSRNGVCLNSSKNRLVRGQPHALKSGDRILIDPYEIRVSIARDQNAAAGRHADELPDARMPDARFDASNPFTNDDPFAPRPIPSSGPDASEESIAGQELDPLELLDLGPKRAPARKAPSARDLELGSPLDKHFQPPSVLPDPASVPPADAITIPQGYDPLAPDEPPALSLPSSPAPPARERQENRPNKEQATPLAPLPQPPARIWSRAEISESVGNRTPASSTDRSGPADLGAVLDGAGLDPANVTPELARTFGRILRVVVSGVMDVMRSRQQIKDEFRMRMTRFKPAENNPLKFSANVDDALHNLLVKRNPAYLGPVEAFEDAFVDLRNHQIAMLAGMRVAFESMLAEFDPDRLQKEFDRQLNKGLVPAKLRYWDLYRERRQDIVKDPEASFRRLFGEEFARAYEEQLKQLKAGAP